MRKTYKSRYSVINFHKYHGNPDSIICRSSPERAICKYFDLNKNIKKWSSESVVVPYVCATDQSWHRYFVDFWAELANGQVLLIEYKPHSQTMPPEQPKRKTKKAAEAYANAIATYMKNISKWKAAKEFATKKGWTFQVWTENHLMAIGIRFV